MKIQRLIYNINTNRFYGLYTLSLSKTSRYTYYVWDYVSGSMIWDDAQLDYPSISVNERDSRIIPFHEEHLSGDS